MVLMEYLNQGQNHMAQPGREGGVVDIETRTSSQVGSRRENQEIS